MKKVVNYVRGGWVGGWVGGCKSRFKDCLQQSQRKRRKITEQDDVLLKYWFEMSI